MNNYFIFVCISVKLNVYICALLTGTALQRLAEGVRSPGTILIPVVSQHVNARNGTRVQKVLLIAELSPQL